MKSKTSGDAYANALKTVEEALAASDAGLREKHAADWASFSAETAIELIKAAAGEYEEAIVKGKIAKPVEYQDARGFVFYAEKMIDGVSTDLETKDADALKKVRAGLVELKKTWPAAMPPKVPVKDHSAVLGEISRIELAAGKLM